MKYFTINECTKSSTIRARRIDNSPKSEHLAHIRESVETLVNPLRETWVKYCRGHVTASHQQQTEELSKLMDIMANCIEPLPTDSEKQG